MIIKIILIIDDSSTFLKAIKYALKSKFLKIITASNIKDALNNIEKIKFDLIISDYSIGSDNGLKILYYLNQKKYNSKFIMLTGSNNNELPKLVEKSNGIFINKENLELINILKKEISSL